MAEIFVDSNKATKKKNQKQSISVILKQLKVGIYSRH